MAELDPPFAFVDLDAMWSNSDDMLRRAGREADPGRIEVAPLPRAAVGRSSIVRGLPRPADVHTARDPVAAAAGFSDLLVAYPTTDRSALRSLAALTPSGPSDAPIVMVDSLEHLD